jgi:hypothetical protein
MRCAFAIDDDLHAFARSWLESPSFDAEHVAVVDGATVERVYRGGAMQVELCRVPAGYRIPEHVHPHADTIEVGVSGAIRLTVNGADPFAFVPDARLAAFTRGRGVRINHADVHGGVALTDCAFWSIQRWESKPTSVLTDYSGAKLGPQHEALCAS